MTYFGLAQSLQKKYECKIFGILDMANNFKKFFEAQDFVEFEKKWFLRDEIIGQKGEEPDLAYLASFEKEYGINLWKLVFDEKNLFAGVPAKQRVDRIYAMLERECRFFERVVEETKPDIFIAKAPWFFEYQWNPFYHLELFRELCSVSNIKTMILSQPHLGGRSMITQRSHKFDSTCKLDDVQKVGRDFNELHNVLKSFDLSKQNKEYLERHKGEISKFQNLFAYFHDADNNVTEKNGYFDKVMFSIRTPLVTKRRSAYINNNLIKDFNIGERFVYFPLSVSNEREILLSAPFYSDQVEVIRHIAKALPIGYKLYVKEHPNQRSHLWRKISEYKEMIKIPNVKLFHPSIPATSFYKNCSLTITISGSSAFEASFYNKPSVIFADLEYSILPSVHVVDELENLPKIIRTALETKVDVKDLDRYLVLLEKNSFDFDSHEFADEQAKYFSDDDFDNTNIIDDKMKTYLENNKDVFDKLASEYVKKIEQHQNLKNSNKTEIR